MKLTDLTIGELAESLASGATTSAAVTDACLDAAEATKDLNALVHLDPDRSRTQAKASDARRASGASLGPLDGVPIALKDLLCDTGQPAQAASRILEGFVAPYDATVVRRLKAAGAVLLGRANMDEFAMGSAGTFSCYGPTKNPWDPTRVPGGSSSGSAAAVAARVVPAALGTDTGGSIRQPAALSGCVGLKPTYGRVSRYGAIAFASSLDQVGPLTRSTRDAALVLQTIGGHDALDSTSAEVPLADLPDAAGRDLSGLTLGLPAEYFGEGLDDDVGEAVRRAAAWYEGQGATIVEVSLPHTDFGIACYYVLAPAEASSNLARYDGVRYGRRAEAPADLAELYRRSRTEGFGDEVRRRILLGTYALSEGYYDAYYGQAQKVRRRVQEDFTVAFEACDALLTPASPTAAWGLDERPEDPSVAWLADIFTVPASLAGLPGLSLPCGYTESGLPIGLQLIGRAFDEATLVTLGHAYETAHPTDRRPEVCA